MKSSPSHRQATSRTGEPILLIVRNAAAGLNSCTAVSLKECSGLGSTPDLTLPSTEILSELSTLRLSHCRTVLSRCEGCSRQTQLLHSSLPQEMFRPGLDIRTSLFLALRSSQSRRLENSSLLTARDAPDRLNSCIAASLEECSSRSQHLHLTLTRNL